MLILKDNKIIDVSISEDEGTFIAVKTVKQAKAEYRYSNYIRDEVYTLSEEIFNDRPAIIFRVTQSPYFDNSGLGSGYGTFSSKGAAINKMLERGFKVYNGDTEITL